MDQFQKLAMIANQISQDEPEPLMAPMPWHARAYGDRGYLCRGCGKLFGDVSSKNRHEAQYCRSYRESERCMSSQRLMGA
jgi:hypothetical protein